MVRSISKVQHNKILKNLIEQLQDRDKEVRATVDQLQKAQRELTRANELNARYEVAEDYQNTTIDNQRTLLRKVCQRLTHEQLVDLLTMGLPEVAPYQAKPLTEAEAINRWYMAGDTGLSSEAIVSQLYGDKHMQDHPWDSDDFGRCLRLLEAVPTLRSRMCTMARVSPVWQMFISNWQVLETSYREEVGGDLSRKGHCPKTNAMIHKLLDH